MEHSHKRREHVLIKGVEYKECAHCLGVFTLSNFNKDSNRWDGLYHLCRECQSNKRVEYHNDNYTKLSASELTAIRSKAARDSTEKRIASFRANGGSEKLAKARSKPVAAKNLVTGEEKTYESAKLAEIDGFNRKDICRAIKGNKPHRGYSWRFV